MVTISFLAAEAVFAAVWLLSRIIVWKRQGQIRWKREALLLLIYVNFAVMIRFVFFPMELADERVQPLIFDPETVFPFRTNLTPIVHLFAYRRLQDLIRNVAGNIALFIPSGIVLPLVYRRLNGFWKTAAAGALISLGIELLQLPFSARTTDVDDLILNTLGVMIGYGIYAAVRRLKRKRSG